MPSMLLRPGDDAVGVDAVLAHQELGRSALGEHVLDPEHREAGADARQLPAPRRPRRRGRRSPNGSRPSAPRGAWSPASAPDSASSGLIVCMLTTVADSVGASRRAASRATATVMPLAIIATSSPRYQHLALADRQRAQRHGLVRPAGRDGQTADRPDRPTPRPRALRHGPARARTGSTTVMLGSARISATSSIAWCDTPSGVVSPGRKPTIFTFSRGYATCIAT